MLDINVKDFSMAEFLAWLSDNKDSINFTDLKQCGVLAKCRVGFSNPNTDTLKESSIMCIKDAHEKLCGLFDIDIERKISHLNISVGIDQAICIETTELKL